MKRIIPGAFIIVFAAIIFTGCNGEASEVKKEPIAKEPEAKETINLEKGVLTTSLQIPGELVAFEQVDIYAKEASFVKRLYVDVGSEVKEGQLLATMDAPEINSDLAAAESRLKAQEALYVASKSNYDRILETSKTPGTIAPNDLDAALAKSNADHAQWQAAKAAWQSVVETKNYLEIRAPFSGVISARNVNTGAYVGPSGKGSEFPMFTLQQQKRLRLAVAVPEAYTSYLHERDTVSFTVNALPNQKFTAQVKRLAGALDARLRAQRVEMDILNADKKLLPGMIANVQIDMASHDSTFLIPRSALVNAPERVFVIRVNGDKAEWIDVKKGRELNGTIEIFGNLSAGDRLIKIASEEIRNGSVIGVK